MSRIDSLRDVVAPAILERAEEVSRKLAGLQVPHALIGGLAVGFHGHARATKDVDFLVPGGLRENRAAAGVPPSYPALADELRLEGDVPVISLRALVLMMLDAFRPRDQEDVRTLLRLHRG